jgi:polyisoprenoid-binding protein YceI
MRHANAVFSLAAGALLAVAHAYAAPVTYKVDPKHTYPSFVADHAGGMSNWRGKFNRTKGTIVLDKQAQSGSVDITVDMSSIDFGLDDLNEHVKKDDPGMFDVARFPHATYKGKLANFKDGKPTEVQGELTLHGVTKPMNLTIRSFMCKPNQEKKDWCGADAVGKFNREDFGVSFGKAMGFRMDVTIEVQVEAIAQ